MENKNWPVEFKEKLILGNASSNVGILTLWTTREFVAEQLDPNSYAVIGNYYDVYNGLEPFVRNCLANPILRYFIIVGNDRSGSKQVLLNFFNQGVENGFVKGTQVPFSPDIPLEDANIFRNASKVFDLTSVIENVEDAASYKPAIESVLKKLEALPPFMKPKTYPKTEFKPEVFPSSGVAYKVEKDLISDAWLGVLKTIQSYGVETKTNMDESSKVRECINIVAVVHEEDPDKPNLPEFMRFGKEKLDEYYKTFCEGKKPKDTAYTYGFRFAGEPENQFINIQTLLKKNKFSKRAFATTWRISDIFSSTPPCVISLQVNVQNDKLFLTAYIRSNDMFRAWPLNAFGLRKIQKNFAQELGYEMASLTIVSQSAHVYKENLKEMEKILEKNYSIKNQFYDKRGYYTIAVTCGEIEVRHFDICGKKLRILNGKSARSIMDDLIGNVHPECPFHLSYLACELSKAEFAIKFGFKYRQDEELVKSS